MLSFKDNIRFGKTDATDEDIANAAKIANAYNFITQSEHGFDTKIGDRGGETLRRSAPACKHRPCHSEESSYPHPRRGYISS